MSHMENPCSNHEFLFSLQYSATKMIVFDYIIEGNCRATTMYVISWFCFYSGHWTTPMINLVFNWRWSLHIRHLLFILFHHYSTPRNCLTVRWVRVENVLKKVIWQPQYTGKDAEYRFYKIQRGWYIYSVNLRWNIWWRNLSGISRTHHRCI